MQSKQSISEGNNKKEDYSAYFSFIKFALNPQFPIPKDVDIIEWERFFLFCKKQAVTGIALEGLNILKRYYSNIEISLDLLFEWIGMSEQIKLQNLLINKRCVELYKIFEGEGFRCCILKGQGNARLYPNPLYRSPGDIDVWVDGSRGKITRFVNKSTPGAFEQSLHIDFPIFKDVPVEVHYYPGDMLRPRHNRAIQRFFAIQKDIQMGNVQYLDSFGGKVAFPTTFFNVIYQMSHIYRHFFIEGIGMKHFVDYYYVLRDAAGKFNKEEIRCLYDNLGMLRFAMAVMWVEKEVLGIDNEYLLVEPDERRGRVVLKEMLVGGHFGRYDSRYSLKQRGMAGKAFCHVCRLFVLSRYFPSESFWKVIRKIENQKWKVKHWFRLCRHLSDPRAIVRCYPI